MCNPHEQTLHVRYRRANEDIKDYMNYVTKEVTFHHRALSPNCTSPRLEYLKLPAKDNKPIGTV